MNFKQITAEARKQGVFFIERGYNRKTKEVNMYEVIFGGTLLTRMLKNGPDSWAVFNGEETITGSKEYVARRCISAATD